MSDSVLDMIDNVIGRYGDAMRWSPDSAELDNSPGGYSVDREALAAYYEQERRNRALQTPSGQPLDFLDLEPDEQEAIRGWIRLHGLDPKDVPIEGILERDNATREWRIQVYRLHDGKIRLLDDGETVDHYVVRRVEKAPLVWRCAQ